LLLSAAAVAYDYPYDDPYLATVVGTPPAFQGQIPDIELQTRHLPQDPDRAVPEALWYGRRFEYSVARQRGPAPLVFAIAGTGGYHNSATNAALLKAF
jgi:hypothetical protein